MKVLIKKACVDKYTGTAYGFGEVIEVSEERGEEMLLATGYVERIDSDAKPKRKKKA